MSEAEFQQAVNFVVNSSGVKLSNDEKLRFYALFKVATDGPCKSKAPSRLKVIEYQKWKAYSAVGNISKEDARKAYIAELSKKVPSWKDAKL